MNNNDNDTSSSLFPSLEHHVVPLHLMKIGNNSRNSNSSSTIRLAGEADACDENGNPVEIQTANPR
jgi:hypothetical protein